MPDPRPIILVDMDGPLAQFDQRVFEVCHDFGFDLDCTFDDGWKHRFLTEHMTPKQAHALRRFVNETRFFLDLDPVPGAIDGMHALAEEADVWICTKPLEVNPWCRDDKGAWVRRYLGEKFERKLILASDKSMVRGDVLLDDAIAPEWVDVADWAPVVYPMPFNRHPESKWAKYDWNDMTWSWYDPIEGLVLYAQLCSEDRRRAA